MVPHDDIYLSVDLQRQLVAAKEDGKGDFIMDAFAVYPYQSLSIVSK